MKTINHWILYLPIIGLVVTLGWRWWPNDLRTVEKYTRELLELVEKGGPESLPVSAARSIEAGSYLATNVMMRLGPPFPRSLRRSEAISLIQQGRMQSDRLTIENRGSEIKKRDDGTIQIDLTIDADISYRGQTEEIIGSYRLIWSEGEKGWKITQADALNVIEHPDGMTF